jgi:aspartate/methionine/tyrosine aminotransferase
MRIDYLSWFKNLDLELEKHPDAHLLLASSVYEPTDLLLSQFADYAQSNLPMALKKPNSWGYEPLLEAISERRSCKPDQIVTTNGASNAIYLVCRALLSPGDHVVVESPGYEPLLAAPEFIGCTIDRLPRRPPSRTVDTADVGKLVRPNTKLLLLSNLHNPTGALLMNRDLKAIAAAATGINSSLKIVVDEIYLDFAGARRTTAANLGKTFISIDSLTKVYGLGSIHCGWIVADEATVDTIRRLHVIVEGSGAKALDGFSATVLRYLDGYLTRSLRIVEENRAILREALFPLMSDSLLEGAIPEQGCICFMRVPGIADTSELCAELARTYGVYVVPGRFFGEPDYIRIGFGGNRDRLAVTLRKLADGMRSLRPTIR